MHYGRVLTSKVAGCIKPPPALRHPQKKEKDTTSPTTTGRPKSTRSCKRCSSIGASSFQNKFLPAFSSDPPVYSAPCGPSCDALLAKLCGCAAHVLHHSQCACALVYPKLIDTLLYRISDIRPDPAMLHIEYILVTDGHKLTALAFLFLFRHF